MSACAALQPLRSRLLGHTGIRSIHGQQRIIATEKKGLNWRPGIISGAQVRPYQIDWVGHWLQIESNLLFKGGFDPDVILQPKLLVRQTGDKLVSAIDRVGLYHLNNVHSFSSAKLKSGLPVDLFFVSALMNSNLWLYLYQTRTRERSRALAQIDIETVEAMPLPPEDLYLETRIAELSQELHLVSRYHRAARASLFVASCMRAIDKLIYDLYRLPEELVCYIETYCTSIIRPLENRRGSKVR